MRRNRRGLPAFKLVPQIYECVFRYLSGPFREKDPTKALCSRHKVFKRAVYIIFGILQDLCAPADKRKRVPVYKKGPVCFAQAGPLIFKILTISKNLLSEELQSAGRAGVNALMAVPAAGNCFLLVEFRLNDSVEASSYKPQDSLSHNLIAGSYA